ncbi:hypothetical protein GS421_02890 [Rhodococcus hoagii]|nr:hypothetical protein [Prescottella equi]
MKTLVERGELTPEATQTGGALRGLRNVLLVWGCLIGIVAMLVAIGTGWWCMTDPLERIRYDDPDAPALFPTPVDAADQAYERARDERIEAFE